MAATDEAHVSLIKQSRFTLFTASGKCVDDDASHESTQQQNNPDCRSNDCDAWCQQKLHSKHPRTKE